ncbi:MAG: DUF1697 domain-containing protein [Chitinophagales bacterium]
MTKYIAFLRAINVGGRVVKMDDLKKHFAMPGFKNIVTYIQSGNVVFDHSETDKDALIKKVESKLLKSLGYEVKTFLKTPAELEAVVKKNPFKKYPEDMGLHVSFMSGRPDAEAVKQLLLLQTDHEQFRFTGSEAYILVRKGAYGETKFSNNFLEKKLKLYATTRNWATVNTLLRSVSFGG